jgi:hypothetical protein
MTAAPVLSRVRVPQVGPRARRAATTLKQHPRVPDLATSRTRAIGVWPSGPGRWAVAVLVGCVGLLATAPVVAASTGAISGTVTEAAGTHKGLANIVVEASRNTEEEPFGTATNANGEYTLTAPGPGLPKGEYTVTFHPAGAVNLVPQTYKEKVPVEEGQTTKNINAAMQVGGEITGTVTDAGTHVGLAKIIVLACNVNVYVNGGSCSASAFTDAKGEYTLLGMETGSYNVLFSPEEYVPGPYVTQYYNNQPSLASANPVAVIQGSVTSGIDAALIATLLKAPLNNGLPAISGTAQLGQTLSCSTGSWTAYPSPSFAYQWRRDGTAIGGTTGSTYIVQAADQGHTLTCEVTASNSAGHEAATSAGVVIPAVSSDGGSPSGGGSTGTGSGGGGVLGSQTAVVSSAQIAALLAGGLTPSGKAAKIAALVKSGGFAVVFKALAPGTVVIDWYQVPPGAKLLARKAKPKPVLVAAGQRVFSAAGTATIKIKLTAAGIRLLKHAKQLKLTAKGTFTPTGKAHITTTRVFVLKH